MRVRLVIPAIIFAAQWAPLQSVQAAGVGGDVKVNVKTGIILQSNRGIANRNEIILGSVTGKNTSVGGDIKTTVKTGAIIQTNTGIANKNRISIGSVTR